jgi:polyhydroxyalkanoate synthase
VTFVLASGGHNAGIVSEPGHRNRRFRIARRVDGGTWVTPDEWAAATPVQEGSWWPAWADWLDAAGSGRAEPPKMGATGYPPLAPAPGSYVLEH